MKKQAIKKYIAMVVCILCSFGIITGGAIAAHNFTAAGRNPGSPSSPNNISTGDTGSVDPGGTTPHVPSLPGGTVAPAPRHVAPDINMVILGVDDEANLPDVILLLTFDGTNNKIDIISVPRDTRVDMTQAERQMLTDANRWFPNHGVVKLNELFAHGGSQHGQRIVTHHLENLFGIEIDHYVILNLAAFRNIVDEVGGITMVIPEPGLVYRQGGTIDINIPPGPTLLDGTTAEKLVRFRNFPEGDLARIRLQQQFMREFFAQVLNNEAIISNAETLMFTFISMVRTDFGFRAGLPLLGAVDALNIDSIEFHTVPGFSRLDVNPEGRNVSFFIVDNQGALELIDQIRAEN